MHKRVVGFYSYPWDTGFDVCRRPGRDPATMYRWALWYKANPRSADYMQSVFASRYPDGEFINVDTAPDWQQALADADTVVLLYPDAIGLGFAALERFARKAKKPWAAIRVLNGRKRDFLLYCGMQRSLKLKRFVERTMLGEMLFILPFALLTPLMLAWDWMRGRR